MLITGLRPQLAVTPRILLWEEASGQAAGLAGRLRTGGYAVEVVSDRAEVLEHTGSGRYALIIIEVAVPDTAGFKLCRELRQRGILTPILMISARTRVSDKVRGLRIGADDYVTKPFEMLELLARVEALVRRGVTTTWDRGWYDLGSIRVDLRRTEVMRDDKPTALSSKEFQLLRYLLEHRGRTLSRQELLREVWGYKSAPATRTVDVHVAWLRQKLEDDPRQPKFILTVHGQGYRFGG